MRTRGLHRRHVNVAQNNTKGGPKSMSHKFIQGVLRQYQSAITKQRIKQRQQWSVQKATQNKIIDPKQGVIQAAQLYHDTFFVREKPSCIVLQTSPSGNRMIANVYNPHTQEYRETFIQSDDLVRKLPRFGGFTANRNSIDKALVNLELVRLVKQYPRPHRRAIVLDDPDDSLTTRLLQATGQFEKGAILVPNLDPDFLTKAHKSFHEAKAKCFAGLTFYEMVRDLPDDEIGAGFDVAYDAMCSVQGSANMHPQADLLMVFSRGILARHHGVLWLSFSVRVKGGGKEDTLKRTQSMVSALASEYGYGFYPKPFVYTYGTMFTTIYVTRRPRQK